MLIRAERRRFTPRFPCLALFASPDERRTTRWKEGSPYMSLQSNPYVRDPRRRPTESALQARSRCRVRENFGPSRDREEDMFNNAL